MRRQIELLMAETIAVGRTVCISAPVDIEARMHYATRLADVKTSMLQNYKAGRDLEPILGVVLELARRTKLVMPTIERTYAQDHERMRKRCKESVHVYQQSTHSRSLLGTVGTA